MPNLPLPLRKSVDAQSTDNTGAQKGVNPQLTPNSVASDTAYQMRTAASVWAGQRVVVCLRWSIPACAGEPT